MATGSDGGSFQLYSPRQVRVYLEKEIPTLSQEVLVNLEEHKIDGEVFLGLNEEYLREIAPLLGDRLKIKRVINTALDKTGDPQSYSPLSSASPHHSTPRLMTPVALRRLESSDLYSDSGSVDGDVSQIATSASHVSSVQSTTSIDSDENDSSAVLPEKPSVSDLSCTEKLPDKDWAERLLLPVRFSAITDKVVAKGVLTKKARVEITTSLSTLMLVHTSRPTPSDLTTVSRRLVEKYPNLRDKVDNGFSSWRRQLRVKFKNLRRPDRASKAGIVVPPAPPKTPSSSEVVDEPSPSLIAEYERHIQFLQRSYASKKWSLASMVTLMEQTAVLRREWVKKEGPSVTQMMEKFPCLADPRIMLNEFCMITGAVSASFEKTWEEYEQLIFKYSPLEEKREVKKLLSEYQAKESECADRRTLYALKLLSVHLGRGKRQALVTVFEGESIDIDDSIATLESQAPLIVVFGESGDSPSDIKIIIENNTFIVPSMVTALHFCFASYYVFDITFPPASRLLLLFLEKYVYNLKTSVPKLPLSIVLLNDNLKRVSGSC